MSKKPPTKDELEYMGKVKRLPCSTCGAPPPSIVHHPRVDEGTSQRAGHYMVIPHCEECHVGPFSIHKSQRQFNNVYGPEKNRINETIGKIHRGEYE